MPIGPQQVRSNAGATPAEEIIRLEVLERGPLTFARFMQLALYHPEHGYYERGLEQIGSHGDYYTSVSVGSVFGQLLGFHFKRCLEAVSTNTLNVVECGAHDGRLAFDILNWMRVKRPDLYGRLAYVIVEPSNRRRGAQKAMLAEHAGRVTWRDGWHADERRWVRGVIFANELLDAFPFHRLRWDARQRRWREMGVGLKDNRLVMVEMADAGSESNCRGTCTVENGPLARADFPELPSGLLEVLPDGFRFDYCPAARIWWGSAACSLAEGALIGIDYGTTIEGLLSPGRDMGTARAYSKHIVSDRLLEKAGEQDLTAHVDFTALIEEGERCGLQTEGFESQERFLMRTAREAHDCGALQDWSDQERRELCTLTHPCHLGRAFRVLRQVRTGPEIR